MAQTIVIKKEYFDNINTTIEAMNKFFGSGFKTKSFPVVNNDFQLDRILARTISWLNNVEPSWVSNPKDAETALNKLRALAEKAAPEETSETPDEPEVTKEADESAADNEKAAPAKEAEDIDLGDGNVTPDPDLGETDPAINSVWAKLIDGTDKAATDTFHQFIGFKMLQLITNHYDEFEQLLNGIYSFQLFIKPSEYRNAIQIFTAPLEVPELTDISPLPGEYKLFTPEDYVGSIFDNDQIKLPDDMMEATEVARFAAYTDLADTEVVIDDTVQEAAKVDLFENFKPTHIKYDPSSGKFKISRQFEGVVDKLIASLQACNSTEDLVQLFSKEPMKVDMFTMNVFPCILLRVFNSTKKYPFDMHDVDATFRYTDSYKSILAQNAGARRYATIDLFSTFKTNKAATIKFLKDFLKLELVNSNRPAIGDRTLLTIFNIFDSHIYYTILYHLIPKPNQSLDEFIKTSRKKVNGATKAANPYQKDKSTSGKLRTSNQVQESVIETMKELGDLSIADTQYCDLFAEAVYDEISTLSDDFYNREISSTMIDRYIGESYDLFPGTGDVYVEWSKRQSAVLAGWVIGALIGGPGGLGVRSALGISTTLLELIAMRNIGSVAGGMIASHYYRKNHFAKDTLEYISEIIDLLKSESKNCESEVKRFKKLCKNLKDSCKVLSHDKNVLASDRTYCADMVVVCKRVISDLKAGNNNAKLMEDFLERLFKIREILTGEKTSDIKAKPIQEAAETGDIPD